MKKDLSLSLSVPGEIVGDNLRTELVFALKLTLAKTSGKSCGKHSILIIDSWGVKFGKLLLQLPILIGHNQMSDQPLH